MDGEVVLLEVRRIQHGVVELRDDSILVFRPDVATFKEYNIQVLEDLLKVFIEMTDGVPRPYLCDNTYITGIIGKEEKEFLNKHFSTFATRAAMITNSSLINIIVNGYNSFYKPEVVIKLFTSEKDAVTWLLSD